MPPCPLSAKSPLTIALDLEGTLISNAMSCFPRPGLKGFLDHCRNEADRVVLFTAVFEERVRPILAMLTGEGSAPAWFRDIEIVRWEGIVKDLRFIPGADVPLTLLVDDLKEYVHPEQESQWVPIENYAAPYSADDRALDDVAREITRRFAPYKTA